LRGAIHAVSDERYRHRDLVRRDVRLHGRRRSSTVPWRRANEHDAAIGFPGATAVPGTDERPAAQHVPDPAAPRARPATGVAAAVRFAGSVAGLATARFASAASRIAGQLPAAGDAAKRFEWRAELPDGAATLVPF